MKYVLIALLMFLILPAVLADEAQLVITSPWLIEHFRPGYEATTAAQALALVGVLVVLGCAFRRWLQLSARQRTPAFWLKAAGGIGIVLVSVFVLYSGYYTMYTGVAKTGIEVCDATGCSISVHWHATLQEMKVCGRAVERPWESGELSEAHTHKDNKIHVHTTLGIDPQTKEILDTTPLTLGAFFDQISWKFSENCFMDMCDACDGTPATTKSWVNDQLVNGDPRSVVWKDGDRIRIVFG